MRWLDGITDSIDVSKQTPRDSEGQGNLVCYSSWGRRELDTTERLNHTQTFTMSMAETDNYLTPVTSSFFLCKRTLTFL